MAGFILEEMANCAVGNHSSPVVCFSVWITGNRETSTLAHVNGSKYCFCSVLWLSPYTLKQWHTRKFVQAKGTYLETNLLGYCIKVHTSAVNGLESHLNCIHFILLYFSLQNWSVPANITLYRSVRLFFNLHGHWMQRVQWIGRVVLQNLGAVTTKGAVPSQRNIFHCVCERTRCYVSKFSSFGQST